MTRKCSLCACQGHNMTTCQLLPFRQDQAHRLYAHMWQKWLETYQHARTVVDDPSEYPSVIYIHIQNSSWLRNPLHFRLLKSYLNLNGRGTDQEISDYIIYLYRYLVLKKNRLFPHIITNQNIITSQYSNYDYLLDTIRSIRQYGIIVELKTSLSDVSLETCDICYDEYPRSNFVKTNCDHSFCKTCVINTIQILPENKKLSCAMCRSHVTHLSCYTSEIDVNLKNALHI